MARAIAVEIVGDASSVNRAFNSAGVSARRFDRELSHTTRGVVAGSGVFRGLGRSLAFASGGFLAFAGIAGTIRSSIEGAESLEKAQRGLDVAIRHTGGSLKTLKPQYEAVAQSAAQFGVNQADATTALNRATLLTGNAVKAQHAYQEALVISKATGKDFNTVLTATAKGQAGVTTSLRRYGILVDATSSGQQQFNTVMARFAGQAKANTSEIDRFNATWQNTEEILGTALLPILNKLLTRFTDWLTKMQKSGDLQSDVNRVTDDAGHVFHALESVVHGVDRVTGSFLHTLELLAAFKFAGMIAGWTSALTGLIAKWGAVKTAAIEAQAAESGGGLGLAAGAVGVAGVLAYNDIRSHIHGAGSGPSMAPINIPGGGGTVYEKNGQWYRTYPGSNTGYPISAAEAQSLGANVLGAGARPTLPAPGLSRFGGPSPSVSTTSTSRTAPHIFTQQFALTANEQLAQAQAQLTRSTTDDVAAAKQVVARIKRLIAQGRLKGKAMLLALGLEANALSTIWSAEDAAAQKRAQAAAAAKAKIQQQIQNSIDPPKLELALARDQALGRSTVKDLLALKRAAEKALASGKLSVQQQIDAYNQIASINQQLGASASSALGGFKQANTRKLTAGLGLTHAQQKDLRARLSQLGPGGTVPGDGTGAFGFVIGKDGRVKGSHSAASAAGSRGGNISNATLIRHLDRLADRPLHVTVDLEGKQVADYVIRYDQRRRRRNPSQRRGPHAATR